MPSFGEGRSLFPASTTNRNTTNYSLKMISGHVDKAHASENSKLENNIRSGQTKGYKNWYL